MFVGALGASLRKEKYKGIIWSPSDLVQALANLSINDSNKQHILACEVVPLLHICLQRSSTRDERFAQEFASQAFWNLAFHPEFAQNVDGAAQGPLMQTLTKLSISAADVVRKNCTGAVFQIKRFQSVSIHDDAPAQHSTFLVCLTDNAPLAATHTPPRLEHRGALLRPCAADIRSSFAGCAPTAGVCF